MPSVEALCALLGLVPHPVEGGFFRETYRSADLVPSDALPARYRGPRAAATAIYYLLTPDTVSAMHRLATDEIFHFYLGDPVEMLQLRPDGSHRVAILGPDLDAGQRPQIVVPRGVWQGARLVPGGRFALLGTTVAPGFDYADYETGERAALLAGHPHARDLIIALTPEGERPASR
ncbi:MAG TPA: cupin domain-containing protein [Methylomirabilota bacterium]|nr:cupin domain-containing protein [Methylomirabilota bacterium]